MRRRTWHDRIASARRRGRFTIQDTVDAASWVTCACGEQDHRIPRYAWRGCPKDELLANAGCQFAYHVDRDRFDDAERELAIIEVRAALLMTGIGAECSGCGGDLTADDTISLDLCDGCAKRDAMARDELR